MEYAAQQHGGATRFARPSSVGRDVAAGAIAGAAATWLMSQATTVLYEREDGAAREREEHARGGETAYAAAVGTLARALSFDIAKERRAQIGNALHWAIGIGAGVGYALARRRWPSVGSGAGIPFGLAFFLLVDEGVNAAFGFTPPPGAFPWQAHARGAAGHVVFGTTTHAIVAALTRPRRHVHRMEVHLSLM